MKVSVCLTPSIMLLPHFVGLAIAESLGIVTTAALSNRHIDGGKLHCTSCTLKQCFEVGLVTVLQQCGVSFHESIYTT